ncbi:MAG TPA: LiaF domain-containing protein [Kofleriaceae bacterium]|nr:LiaF domain-containing protein [Kofleriaceae bacterium]
MNVSEEQRERVVESLSTGYAHGILEQEELERRLALVQTAKSSLELDALVTDLARAPETTALVPAKQMRVIFGSIERVGPWAVPQQLRARVLFGNLELDLRDARLSPGVTTIEVDVTMGNVEVIVPPGYQVDVEASSLLGAVEERTERVASEPTSIIRVVGRVRFGHLEVSTLHRGETRRDARYRRRADRKWRRRMMRDCSGW